MLYSPGMGGEGGFLPLQGTAHSLQQPAQRPSRPGHREPSDHLYGALGLTTGMNQRGWPRCLKWPRSRAVTSTEQQPLFRVSPPHLVPVFRGLCCRSRRLLAFNSRTQPTVEYHLLALQLYEAGKLCQPACSQWACTDALLQTGSYRSARRCQFGGLTKYCPEGKVMTQKDFFQSHPTARLGTTAATQCFCIVTRGQS